MTMLRFLTQDFANLPYLWYTIHYILETKRENSLKTHFQTFPRRYFQMKEN